jgi:hypothetical protein
MQELYFMRNQTIVILFETKVEAGGLEKAPQSSAALCANCPSEAAILCSAVSLNL